MAAKQSAGLKSRRLVVVGGGVAGSLIANLLQFDADVTLIDPKEYFDITWASLRAMVEPSFAKRSVISHKEYLKKGKVVASPAVNITDTDVITADGLVIGYDYLVIATGHSGSFPNSRAERLLQYQTEYAKISSSGSILIIGGGPTGVELSAEIAADFPGKKVTLVHRGPRLLEFIGQKAGDKAFRWLKSKGVEVILNQSVDLSSVSHDNSTYKTLGGQTIRADCHFLCTVKPLASDWLKDTVLKDSVDGKGMLMVDEYLRVRDRWNVFAIGDITNVPEMKQGYIAEKHASVAANNLKLLMTGERVLKMTAYKPGPEVAIVSLGRRDAVAQLPFATVSGFLPGLLKKDMFVGKTRKARGLDPDLVEEP